MGKEEDVRMFVEAVAAGMRENGTLQGALDRFVGVFHRAFDIWAAGICSITATHVRVDAFWSAVELPIETGTEIATSLTPDASEAVRKVLAGRIARGAVTEESLGLFGGTLRDLGGVSWMLLPVWDGVHVVGMIAIMSASSGSLESAGEEFFQTFAREVSPHVAKMLVAP